MKQTGTRGAEGQEEQPGSRRPVIRATADLLLASASPRRRELLKFLGLPFLTIATDGEERAHPPPPAIASALPTCPVPLATHPTLLAWRKADAACAEAPGSVIIGADTIVVLDSDVLGKPRDTAQARAMLRRLSGRTHTVYTGLALISPETRDTRHEIEAAVSGLPSLVSRLQLDLVASDVTIADLIDAEIEAYVATGEPMDKAGAYGIQGLGGRLVRSVAGSYTNVVGLPLVATHRLLAAAGYTQLTDPTDAYLRWLEAQGKEPLPCPPTFP
jgi:septum formation protein